MRGNMDASDLVFSESGVDIEATIAKVSARLTGILSQLNLGTVKPIVERLFAEDKESFMPLWYLVNRTIETINWHWQGDPAIGTAIDRLVQMSASELGYVLLNGGIRPGYHTPKT